MALIVAPAERCMPDLNDYVLFAQVVTHGGFAAAGRALGTPKSTLSRRLAALETRLGVRLVERSTRRFRVTEVGEAFYERCRTVMLDAEQAEAVVAEARSEPRGVVRCSCPTGLVELLSPVFAGYLDRRPKVRLQLVAVDRPVDLIAERIDLAVRVRTELLTDSALTMRTLGRSHRCLVAAPRVAAGLAGAVPDLDGRPTLSSTDQQGEITWSLVGPNGAAHDLRHEPRMTCGDFGALREAAVRGLGVAFLPDHVCARELREGALVRLFPEWRGQEGVVHLVFTTRRGLPPAVRALIDDLAIAFRSFEGL